MGFDGLISFLIRNLPNDAFDDVDLNINHNKLLSKHVLIDISFILYNCYLEVEDNINNILKYICGISCSNYSKVINLIEAQLLENHWKNINIKLDGIDQNEICKNFIESICEDDNKILDDIMLKNVSDKLEKLLSNIFALDFVDNVVLFFDSIPSYSKILEQRKRRLKNYLESQNRKHYYKEYFTNLKNRILYDEKEDFEFDYFSWISNKFSCNKIIDSNSAFIKKLKNHLIENLNFDMNPKTIEIKVDNEEFGEADYKIFKYISKNNLDDIITILSCDSDLVYQIITQQLNYKSLDKKIKLNLCKFYINSFDHCQHYNANKIIDNLSSNYKESNNCSYDGEFCLDFMIILNFFGNDLLPSSFEIGPEFNLNTLIKIHYNALGKEGKSLIKNNISKDVNYKTLDLDNFKKLLREINKNSIFTKIVLLRFYKVPYNIVTLFTDKLCFKLIDVKNFLEEYLIFKGYIEIEKKKNILDTNDIRFIKYEEFKNKIKKEMSEEIAKQSISTIDESYNECGAVDLSNNEIDVSCEANQYLSIKQKWKDVSGESYETLEVNKFNNNDLNNNDNKLLKKIEEKMVDPIKNNSFHFNNNSSNIMGQLENLLDDYLDFTDLDNLGLLNHTETLDLDGNMYQNLYNYISSKSNLDRGTYSNFKLLKNDALTKDKINIKLVEKSINSHTTCNSDENKILIDFNLKMEDSSEEQVENYLMMIYYTVKNFFNDMSNYNSTNLSVYKYDNVPSLKNIISFLDKSDLEDLSNKFMSEIENNILSKEKYFNPILHHLIITPYLLESNYLNLMNNKEILGEIINNFDSILSNIWNYESYNFEFIKSNKFIKDKLKYIDPKLLLNSWNELLLNISKIHRLEYSENLLINF